MSRSQKCDQCDAQATMTLATPEGSTRHLCDRHRPDAPLPCTFRVTLLCLVEGSKLVLLDGQLVFSNDPSEGEGICSLEGVAERLSRAIGQNGCFDTVVVPEAVTSDDAKEDWTYDDAVEWWRAATTPEPREDEPVPATP